MAPVIAAVLALFLSGGSASFQLLAQARGSGRRLRQTSTNPLGRGQEVIEAGRQLYNSTCTVCHGMEGTVGDRGPALAATRRYLRTSDDDLFGAIKNGIPGTLMPALGAPENEVWKIVAYIRSLRATASDEFVPGNADHGREVFQAKGRCAECHMIQGRGGLLGPDLSNIGAERSLRTRFAGSFLTKPGHLNIPRAVISPSGSPRSQAPQSRVSSRMKTILRCKCWTRVLSFTSYKRKKWSGSIMGRSR